MREQVPNEREEPRVRGRIRTGSASNRRLVDVDHFVDLVKSLDRLVRMRHGAGSIKLVREDRIEGLVDEGRFSGAADAGDADKRAQRNFQGNVLQIIAGRTGEGQELAAPPSPLFRYGDCLLPL